MNYFDYTATCPIDEEALETYVQASRTYFANASSIHDPGMKAKELADHCREKLSNTLNVEAEGIYFTSGGTESNELALYALIKAGEGKHILTSEAEHSSIRNLCSKLNNEGYEVSKVPFTEKGEVDVKRLKQEIRKDTVLVSIQHVNSDIGTVQPLQEIAKMCKKQGVLFHSDCVQSFGKLDVKEIAPLVDSLSVSSHKVYGPKGVGAVYIRPSLSFQPRIPGGTHESGIRPGTLNIPGIAAFTVAAEKMVQGMKQHQDAIVQLKKEFFSRIEKTASHWSLLGETMTGPVPIIGLSLRDMEGQWALLEGNRNGFAFSTGSACQADKEGATDTLLAMGKSEEEAKSFIRISLSHKQKKAEISALSAWLNKLMIDPLNESKSDSGFK